MPPVQILEMNIVGLNVLLACQVRHEASLDCFRLGMIYDSVQRVSDAKHRKVVRSHHFEFAFEATGHDAAHYYWCNISIVPETYVEVLLYLIYDFLVFDLD